MADLLLDLRNARVGEEQPSQQAVYLALAEQQGRRLLRLAEDIVERGLDPTAVPAVVATRDQHRRYRVLEGNRRILALKALETPTIVAPVLSSADNKKLGQLATRFAKDPVDTVPCVLFGSEAEARHWIELRHTGPNEGVGLVEWTSDEKDRYRARHAGIRNPAGQVIEFVAQMGTLSAEAQSSKVKITTNLGRLVSTRAIKDAIGLEVVDGLVVSQYPAGEIAKPLTRFVEDLKTKNIRVKDIYDEADRRRYIKNFAHKELPKASSKLSGPVKLSDLAAGKSTPAPTPTAKMRRRKVAPDRTTMVPRDCPINPAPPRINAIYNELATLNLDQHPNACAVLLRVFVELSVDHELEQLKAMAEEKRRTTSLAKRMKVLAAQMRGSNRIPKQLEVAIVKLADTGSLRAASAITMNQYVHNKYVFPKPSELRAAWDELQPFIEEIWS